MNRNKILQKLITFKIFFFNIIWVILLEQAVFLLQLFVVLFWWIQLLLNI